MLIDVLGDFKPCKYNDSYFIGTLGDVYSTISNKFLKHYIDHDGYHRIDLYIDGKPKHMKLHKLVYESHVGDIPNGMILRHINDDKDTNWCENIIPGTQKDNVADLFRNGHNEFRGNISHLIIKDKNTGEINSFCPANKFIEFSNHPCSNGSILKMINSNWFAKDYELIEFKSGKV